MAEKGYYYLKLKENFFESDELKILESMENGYLYSNILLKLYLKALKNDGRLTFNEFIPYDVKMLATITGHNIDITEKALTIFKRMGLIEVLDNGTIYMMNMQQMIGSISSEGVRKAEYRERIKIEKQGGTSLGQCPNIISNSISNSLSNSNIEKEKINKRERFVPPTLEQVTEYAKSKGRGDLASKFLEYYTVANWVDSKGNKVKNWKQKFLTWIGRESPNVTVVADDRTVLHDRKYTKEDIEGLVCDIDEIEI